MGCATALNERFGRLRPVPSLTVANTKQGTAKKAAASKKAVQKRVEQQRAVTQDVQAGDELPLVVVKGRKRQQARLQLGEGGKIYTVTKPKDMYFGELQARVVDLNILANPAAMLEEGIDEAEILKKVEVAMGTLREFVTCVFDESDHDEVMTHLLNNSNNEEVQDLSDGMRQCLEIWRAQASTGS